jgi:hypothetical protein
MVGGPMINRKKAKQGEIFMTTTGELRAIIEELELVDIGDAASYLGEEAVEIDDTIPESISMVSLAHYLDCNSNN